MIDQLNALAKRIPGAAFKAAGLPLDCVTYVYVYEGEVVYAGEGKLPRVTKHLTTRGQNSPDFDDFIDMFWDDPELEVYLAASKINKGAAREFENILIKEFDPPFNDSKSSRHHPYSPTGRDWFGEMKSAEKLDISRSRRPPGERVGDQTYHWKRQAEFPLDASLEFISEINPWRPNTSGHDLYTMVLSHRPRTVGNAIELAQNCARPLKPREVQGHLRWLYAWHGGRYLKIAGKRFAHE